MGKGLLSRNVFCCSFPIISHRKATAPNAMKLSSIAKTYESGLLLYVWS